MSLDETRIKKFLQEITRGSGELKTLVRENQLKPGSVSLKAAALRAQHPDWSAQEVEKKVREIFLYART